MPETLFRNLAPALRWLRLGARLTQRELSRRARIGPDTLRAFERGKKTPSVSQLERLLAELGVTLLELKEAMDRVDGHEQTIEAMTVYTWHHLPLPGEEPWSKLKPPVAALAARSPAHPPPFRSEDARE